MLLKNKSTRIPSGTGSGMVIPASPLFCWMTEDLWGLFLLFLSSPCYSKLLWNSSHPHPPVSKEVWRDWWHPCGVQKEHSEWEHETMRWGSGEKALTHLQNEEFNGLTKSVKLLFPLGKYRMHQDHRQQIQFLTLKLVSCGVRLIFQFISPYTGIKNRISKCLHINLILWRICCTGCRSESQEIKTRTANYE